uniref:SDR family oxidoreductase n=1 Tax=Nonomuraea bangladeshensis TaxID=404385 RepID=UPI003F490951
MTGTAIVTGAANGIGLATTRLLARQGMRTVLLDVDERGSSLAEELGPGHRFVHFDVRDAEGWRHIIDSVLRDNGTIDVLFLNAGVMSRPAGAPLGDDPVKWLSHAAYERVREINLDGVINGILASLSALRRQGSGQVLITSSVDAFLPYDQDPFYAMTKAAQVSLVRSLAEVLKRFNVRINAICPFSVSTQLTPSDLRDIPGRSISAEEFGRAVLHVLDSEVTGGIWMKRETGKPPYLHIVDQVPGAADLYESPRHPH